MRPINRGDWPKNNGIQIDYSDYQLARPELIKRIGDYCSYCEMQLDASLAVEHVKPKKPSGTSHVDPSRLGDWNNFLLACTNCNSTKSDTEVVVDDYYWPDRDNTFRAFTYTTGGQISPSAISDNTKANKTIDLVGLTKNPNGNSKSSDRRWENRREVWDIANRNKDRLSRNNSNIDFRECIVDLAVANGYWSIWMTVFSGDPDMLHRFIQAFPGTENSCFDSAKKYVSVKRPTGKI